MHKTVYTIGHSNHSFEEFLRCLTAHGVGAIVDVRSRPYSRYNPQFDRETLRSSLKAAGIEYVYLGDSLGARSETPSCYENGKVRYDRLAQTEAFRGGLARVAKGAEAYRVCLMCAEKEPEECHRTILVSRHLQEMGFPVQHILADASLRTQNEVVEALMTRFDLRQNELHLFRSEADLLDDAYRLQEARIAYEMAEEKPDASAA
jgi:uncharacterized protein (DUF488 family)